MRAVIAESYERIHRSNLIGMGVLPLQFPDGETRRLARPRRHRDLLDHGRHRAERRRHAAEVHGPATRADGRVVDFHAVLRIDTPGEADYYRNGGILQYVLRSLVAG